MIKITRYMLRFRVKNFFLILMILMIVFISGCNTQNSLDKNKEIKLNEETIVVKSNQIFYSGSEQEEYIEAIYKFHYIINSSEPIDVYVVPSYSDFKLIKPGKTFLSYVKCTGIQILRYDKQCTISNGGIAILNKNIKDAVIELKTYYFSSVEKEEDKKIATIISGSEEIKTDERTFILKPFPYQYYIWFSGEMKFKIHYIITASKPVSIYLVSIDSSISCGNDLNILTVDKECTILGTKEQPGNVGISIFSNEDTEVTIKLYNSPGITVVGPQIGTEIK